MGLGVTDLGSNAGSVMEQMPHPLPPPQFLRLLMESLNSRKEGAKLRSSSALGGQGGG
jgi:hypothetical protein